ncbi:MAG: type I-C CRISPR-associated protein Cas5c [Burkholderiales bacterium]|nr:type I-C CRISPR-associated protein Cas5c [Burkholderiales bacterium]
MTVRLHVQGEFALFSRPELRVERVSYDVPTPSAAQGILEAIHWKPAITWITERIHVLKPIRFVGIRRNEVKVKAGWRSARGGGIDISDTEGVRVQRTALVLADVAYVIEARLELTDKAGEQDSLAKHYAMFERRAAKGQCFHQPCLGTREFACDFTLLKPDDPLPPGLSETRDLGLMVHGLDYPPDGRPTPRYFRATMTNGVITVPHPRAAEVLR